jgi:hypothetical protein
MDEKEEIDALVTSYRTGVWYSKLFIVPRILYPFVNLGGLSDMYIQINIPGYKEILMNLTSKYKVRGKGEWTPCLPEVLSNARLEETQNVQTQ